MLWGVVTGLALVAGTAVPSAARTTAVRSAGASSTTVWLCRPGQTPDPCAGDLTTTAVSAGGKTTTIANAPDPSSKFDCFYVYPTVSRQKTDNANLKVQPTETGVAVAQAAQFSQVCNVWSPVYRQRTAASLAKGFGSDPTADQVAYASVLSGWKDYLAHDNDGRPVVFIGQSQGAAMLIRLLRQQIDPHPALRRQMVSAIILGGNVQVPRGRTVGGSFRHIPTCGSPTQVGCVIAYSSFSTRPPSTSYFGRPGQGVSLQSGQTRSAGQQVACVNPVTFGSGAGALDPYFPSVTQPVPGVPVSTPWVSFPALYTARCASRDGATWLSIGVLRSPGDPRPIVQPTLGPNWGLHAADVNLALGNLVHDVGVQEAAYP
ncbi:MAG: DUF3089 domain-containing protein [Acidimicrobiales bacterium]